MKHPAGIFFGILLSAVIGTAQSKDDTSKETNRAQLVTTGEITKVDTKKKTLQVKELVQSTTTGPRDAPRDGTRTSGGGGGGGGVGGRRRGGGGVNFPGGAGGRGRYPGGGTGTGPTAPQAKQYKVFVTKDTVMKLADTTIDFSDLHVGDRVTISGFPKGSKDLEASTITRNFQ
jgi:hypothetical protein